MLPLILGSALASGASGSISGWLSADEERKRVREKNAQIDAAKARVDEERRKLREDTKSLSTDFMTNYITVRDPNKAEGIRQSYGQNMAMHKSSDAQLGSQLVALDASKESTGVSPFKAALSGFGIGALQGTASAIGSSIGSETATPSIIGPSGLNALDASMQAQESLSQFNPLTGKRKTGLYDYDLLG